MTEEGVLIGRGPEVVDIGRVDIQKVEGAGVNLQ